MRQLRTHPLPRLVDPAELTGSAVIVIDLLRASTTICRALAAGATSVVPMLEVADTLAAARHKNRHQLVLGGEREGQRIDRFDLGNSPSEYRPDTVAGRQLLFTTTNGTRALHHAREARAVLIGAAVNARAVAAAAAAGTGRIDLLCAGTDGHITGEDLLAAGAIACRIGQIVPESDWHYDDETESAMQAWEELTVAARDRGWSESAQLALQLTTTRGGQNLIRIGKAEDLPQCAQLDILSGVPAWNRQTGQIRLR